MVSLFHLTFQLSYVSNGNTLRRQNSPIGRSPSSAREEERRKVLEIEEERLRREVNRRPAGIARLGPSAHHSLPIYTIFVSLPDLPAVPVLPVVTSSSAEVSRG